MSNDFKKVLVKDDRLMVSDSIEYAVFKGGQSIVPSTQPAVSQSSQSSVQFNIQVPSEQTLLDRRVMWTATASIQVTVPDGFEPVYGVNFALAPFPLHQLATTIQTTINNNSTSINIRDVLPALLKNNDCRELLRYSSTTPCMSDVLKTYYVNSASTGAGLLNNILGGYEVSALDNDFRPNGSFVGYGSNLTVNRPSNVSVLRVGTTQNYTIQFTTCEPLICPPFAWNEPMSNNSAMYGLQNMNVVINLGSANRAVRVVPVGLAGGSLVSNFSNVILNNVLNSNLLLNYITPHPSDLMSARNVVPYLEFPRYFSSSNQPVPLNSTGTRISSSTFNLNQIPDKLIIFVRKPQNSQTPSDSDYSFPITNISINFNNNSGILSSASQYDLFRYSVESGSTQSFDEFSGVTNVGAGLSASNTLVPTVGSYLMLEFGKHIQLVEDYYAAGSLGNFQLQFDITVAGNYQNFPAGSTAEINYETAFAPEVVLITQNSGIFVTERGQSSVYTGILTKQDVLDASQSTPINESSVRRVVGGSKSKMLNMHKMKQLNMTQRLHGVTNDNSARLSMKHPLSNRLM